MRTLARSRWSIVLALWAFSASRVGGAPLILHVAPGGRDDQSGSEAAPWATVERARDEIRARRRRGELPAGGVEVRVQPGEYRMQASLRLGRDDSGTPQAPVVFRSAGPVAPRFQGGIRLREWSPVTDARLRQRLPESVRDRVREANLSALGVTNLPPFELGGFSSGRGFRTHPAMELYVDGAAQTLARWPDEGFVKTGEVQGPLSLSAWDRKPGTPVGRFRFEGDRPLRWVGEPEAWLYGYWFWDWADSYEKIERIDVEAREILLAKPWHTYGYRRDQRFHAVNLLPELDQPGEWYLDRETRKVLWLPARDPAASVVELSVLAEPLLVLDAVAHVRFEGLLWELGASDGIRISGGEHCRFLGCTIRKMAGTGVEVRGGTRHELRSCDIHMLGRGGVALVGGDRRTLTPGGHRVENCHIHHLSRIDHTYTPGVWVDGVGQVLRNNLIHDVASSAMRIEGNDHLIERNEAHHVVLESDDQGAVDMFGNATYRGVVYRHNYWHHLGAWDGRGDTSHAQRAGIRLDDAICGVRVLGNVFQRCSTGKTHFGGVQIHGGKENLVEGNLFVDTAAGVSFTPWGEKRWREFVARALEGPAVDRALYVQRYPDLERLAEGHDLNTVRSNVTLRCPTFLLRSPKGTEVSGNREYPTGTELPEGSDGRLRWSEEEAARLGVGTIPFGEIGLYADEWRTVGSPDGRRPRSP